MESVRRVPNATRVKVAVGVAGDCLSSSILHLQLFRAALIDVGRACWNLAVGRVGEFHGNIVATIRGSIQSRIFQTTVEQTVVHSLDEADIVLGKTVRGKVSSVLPLLDDRFFESSVDLPSLARHHRPTSIRQELQRFIFSVHGKGLPPRYSIDSLAGALPDVAPFWQSMPPPQPPVEQLAGTSAFS